MSADRSRGRSDRPAKPTMSGGRYVRFSWRFSCWQVQLQDRTWRNVRPELARCYVAAGLEVLI